MIRIRKAVLILSMAAIAVAGGTASSQSRTEVTIKDFMFSPKTLTVPVGTTVTWTNNDDDPHTVASIDKTTFKSSALDTGEKYLYTFTKPGKYAYFCSVHPKMTAEVVVQ
jgi:plastocyanin